MIDIAQFRSLIIDRTLHAIDLYSEAASNLLLGTALVESDLTYIKQIQGPALGFFQMEPATHDDIWRNYLRYNDDLRRHASNYVPGGWHDNAPPPADDLVACPAYAAAMCRVHYRRVPSPLPEAGDIDRLAVYWKAHYNTELGKGEPKEFVRRYQQHVEA